MALFESKESKEEKKARKIAEAEQKQAEKDFALLQKYGLTGLQDPEDIQSVRNIVGELRCTETAACRKQKQRSRQTRSIRR